jgi:hypothetical protein
MANVKLLFYGSERSKTSEHELTTYATISNELLIEIDCDKENEYYKGFIILDRETAIKFSKEIRKQISYLESEVENG